MFAFHDSAAIKSRDLNGTGSSRSRIVNVSSHFASTSPRLRISRAILIIGLLSSREHILEFVCIWPLSSLFPNFLFHLNSALILVLVSEHFEWTFRNSSKLSSNSRRVSFAFYSFKMSDCYLWTGIDNFISVRSEYLKIGWTRVFRISIRGEILMNWSLL